MNDPEDMLHPSPFMIRAAKAYQRSARDNIALVGEMFQVVTKAEEWPGASPRLRCNRCPRKLWLWAMRRWGRSFWPRIEYQVRSEQSK
jgi:hypothetical protein